MAYKATEFTQPPPLESESDLGLIPAWKALGIHDETSISFKPTIEAREGGTRSRPRSQRPGQMSCKNAAA